MHAMQRLYLQRVDRSRSCSVYVRSLSTGSESITLEKERKIKVDRKCLSAGCKSCHQKRWAVPIYSCKKDGADHNPQFRASVVVNSINFGTPSISKSLKEAQNDCAKLAFLHFTSDDKLTVKGSKTEQSLKGSVVSSNALSNSNVMVDANAICGGPKTEQALKDGDMNSSTSSIEDEMQQNYKMKLQVYAQRKELGLPLYHTKREEQSNTLCFKAKVTVGQDLFKSPGFYKTTKHAENAAAQAALMSLSIDAFRESDVSLYKNLLQEFAQDNGFFLPNYKTMKSGEAHKPTFFSTVEVEGEIFHGNPEKSKKLAEFSAAKVAYTAFMHRKSCLMGDNSSSSAKDEILELAPSLDSLTFADQKRNSKPGSQGEERKDSSSKKTREDVKTYLLCNRIRVYTGIPDMTFSEGNVALPIAEGKWVVVNLVFPQEKNASPNNH